MRLNKFLSENSHLSRRKADLAISERKVYINDKLAMLGDQVSFEDDVFLNGKKVIPIAKKREVLLLNKPVGYVCSKDGQGSKTIYELIPSKYKNLNPVGRLDKDSRGLVILTNDGDLLNKLSHPSNNKTKVYEIETKEDMYEQDFHKLLKGVYIGDERESKFANINKIEPKRFAVVLEEGRNRQIRRTIEALKNEVVDLKRTKHAEYELGNIEEGNYSIL